MAESLKQKAAKGLVWKFLGQGGTQLIQFISGIYIARILSPEDYGLIGMMAIFLGISQLFVDSGFRATLIQKGKEVTHDHYNVVFIFNISVSVLFYVIIFFGAPYIVSFYDEPRLLWVSRILAVNIILSSLGLIHQTILEKKLNFRTLTKIRLVSVLTSVLLGVILAVRGYGVWALVAMTISESLVRVVLISWVDKWSPTFSFNTTIFRELFSKGITIFFAGILQQINNNLFAMIIGKYFTTTDVGYYSQGRKLQKRIVDFINSTIQGVMYPVQSLMQDDIPRLKNAVRKNVKITTLVIFPAALGLIAIAKPFILLFLTEKWLPSVYFLRVLSIAGLIYIIRTSASSFLMAMGRFNIIAWIGSLNSILLITIIALGLILKVDIKTLVLGKILQETVSFWIIVYYSQKIVKYRINELIGDIFPALVYSTVMLIFVILLGSTYEYSLWMLFIQTSVGVIIYGTLNYIFNRRMFYEIMDQIRAIISH